MKSAVFSSFPGDSRLRYMPCRSRSTCPRMSIRQQGWCARWSRTRRIWTRQRSWTRMGTTMTTLHGRRSMETRPMTAPGTWCAVLSSTAHGIILHTVHAVKHPEAPQENGDSTLFTNAGAGFLRSHLAVTQSAQYPASDEFTFQLLSLRVVPYIWGLCCRSPLQHIRMALLGSWSTWTARWQRPCQGQGLMR